MRACPSGLLFCFFLSAASFAAHPEVKKLSIEGRSYSCRPTEAQVLCPLDANLGFVTAMAVDAANTVSCVQDLKSSGPVDSAAAAACFPGPMMKRWGVALSLLMVNKTCEDKLLDVCKEVRKCRKEDPQTGERYDGSCGYLGDFLDRLEKNGLSGLFTESQGLEKCNSIL